ncbi:MAG: polysaccharide deacetylase family protein [Anaerolineales bacterium]|nr:polysaccharide deacetylase family protein [Anaerolineales bacterium]
MKSLSTLFRVLADAPRWARAVLLCVLAFSLSFGPILISAQPAYGRWIVPHTLTQPALGLPYLPAEWEFDDLERAAAAAPVSLPDEARVPVLMYHYVSELPSDADAYRVDLTVPPESFRAQLQYLADEGYHAITLTDLYRHLTEGYPLPDRPIILTFDDGYRDAYEVVFPLLVEFGFSGTFFVLATPAHHEWNEYLTWSQIKEMADAGMDIQAHGRDHVDLRGRSYDYLVYQVLGIKEAVEAHTGQPVRFFCYPSGQYDEALIEMLRSVGYWGAVTTHWGKAHTREGLMELARVRVRGQGTLEDFIASIEK